MSASIANSAFTIVDDSFRYLFPFGRTDGNEVLLIAGGTQWDETGGVGGGAGEDGDHAVISGEWAEYRCHVGEWKPWVYKIEVSIYHYKSDMGGCNSFPEFYLLNQSTGIYESRGSLRNQSGTEKHWEPTSVEGDPCRNFLHDDDTIRIKVESPERGSGHDDAKVHVRMVAVNLSFRRPRLSVPTTSLDLGNVYIETSNTADSTATLYNRRDDVKKSFTIENNGDQGADLYWQLDSDENWLRFAPPSGTPLTDGMSSTIRVWVEMPDDGVDGADSTGTIEITARNEYGYEVPGSSIQVTATAYRAARIVRYVEPTPGSNGKVNVGPGDEVYFEVEAQNPTFPGVGISKYMWKANGSSLGETAGPGLSTTKLTSSGEYLIYCKAVDDNGVASDTVSIPVRVWDRPTVNDTPPQSAIDAGTVSWYDGGYVGVVDKPVNLMAEASLTNSDEYEAIDRYRWDIGDDGTFELNHFPNEVASYTSQSPNLSGIMRCKAVTNYGVQSDGDRELFNLKIYHAVEVDAGGPYTGRPGEPVELAGSIRTSYPGASSYYQWRCRVDTGSGLPSHALQFDGVDEYVDLGNPTELQIKGDQTIEMWINPADFDDRTNPYAKAFGGEGTISVETNGTVNYYYGITGGDWYDDPGDPADRGVQGFEMTSSLASDTWTHLAVVRDLKNGKLRWYKNGALTDSTVALIDSAAVSSSSAYIGKGYAGNFSGRIGNLSVWNRALGQADIQEHMTKGLMGDEPGLEGYWSFDEKNYYANKFTKVTDAIDLSRYGNHGKLKNMNAENWIDSGGPVIPVVVIDTNFDGTGEFVWPDGMYEVQFVGIVTTEEGLVIAGNACTKATIEAGIPTAMPGGPYRGGIRGGSFSPIQLEGNPPDFVETVDIGKIEDWFWVLPGEKSRTETALSFDGVDEYVDLGNPPELQITGSQTIEMWINPADFDDRTNPYAKAFGGEGTISVETNGTVNYYYGITGGDWYDDPGDPADRGVQGFEMTSSLASDTWTHLAVVRDLKNGKLRWYKNGALTDSTDARFGSVASSASSAYIGKGYAGNFRGLIGELRIWNAARTASDIRENMNVLLSGNEPALAGYWCFGEGEGDKALDLSSARNDGTLVNMGSENWVASEHSEVVRGIWNPTSAYPKAGTYPVGLCVKSQHEKWSPVATTQVEVIDGTIEGYVRAADLRTPVREVRLTLTSSHVDPGALAWTASEYAKGHYLKFDGVDDYVVGTNFLECWLS